MVLVRQASRCPVASAQRDELGLVAARDHLGGDLLGSAQVAVPRDVGQGTRRSPRRGGEDGGMLPALASVVTPSRSLTTVSYCTPRHARHLARARDARDAGARPDTGRRRAAGAALTGRHRDAGAARLRGDRVARTGPAPVVTACRCRRLRLPVPAVTRCYRRHRSGRCRHPRAQYSRPLRPTTNPQDADEWSASFAICPSAGGVSESRSTSDAAARCGTGLEARSFQPTDATTSAFRLTSLEHSRHDTLCRLKYRPGG